MNIKIKYSNVLVSHDSFYSNRTLPINLKTRDIELFSHEFEKKIPSCFAKIENYVYIVNNSICHLLGFGTLSKYSKSSAAGRRAKLLRVVKFFQSFFQEKQLIPKGTWIIDDWSLGYFHWFADALTRAELVINYTHKYPLILPAEFEKIPYINKSLEMLDIPCIYLEKNKPSKVQELLITSYTAPTGNYNKALLQSLSNRFRKWVEKNNEKNNNNLPHSKHKIFVSRANTYRRRISNEHEILPIINNYGFEVIHPENISFEEQVKLFYSTAVLVGLHGAGLTNMIFMQPGSTIIEIRRHGDSLNNCFFTMASDLGMKYFYVFAHPENENLSDANCHIELNQFESILSSYDKLI